MKLNRKILLMIWLLIQSLFRRHVNQLRQKTAAEKLGLVFIGLLFIVFYLLLMKHIKHSFGALVDLQSELGIVYGLSLLFSYAFIYLFLIAMSTDIQYFEHNPDLSLLIPMPIPPHILWFYKLIETLVSRSLFLFFLLVTTLSYGFFFNAAFIFYLIMPIFLAGFCFIPVAAGALAILFPIRWLNNKRIRQTFKLLAWITAFAIWLMLMFIALLNPDGSAFILKIMNVPGPQLSALLKWLPSGWIAATIAMFIAGKTFSAVICGLPLIIVPFGLFHFARLNLLGKALFSELVVEPQKTTADRIFARRMSGPFSAIFRFMAISSLRDYDYFKQKFLCLFTIVVLLLMAQRLYFRLVLFYLTLFPILAMHIDATLIFRDGKSFWWFKVHPDKIFYFVFSKFLVSLLSSLTVVTVALGSLVLVYRQYWTLDVIGIGWLRLLAVSLLFSGLSMAVGSRFANFQHPKFKLTAFGMLCSLIFMISGLIYFAFNMDILKASASVQIVFELIISIIIIWGSLKKAAKDLELMEWEI